MKKPDLIVSVSPAGWPPYIIPGATLKKTHGIMPEILREAACDAGLTVRFACYPEKRGMLLLREGSVHVRPKAQDWVNNPSNYSWTVPILPSEDILIFNKKNVLSGQPEDWKNVSIGAVHGYGYPTLQPLFEKGTLRRHNATSTENLMRMLQRGHIDAAVTNRLVAEWIIKNNNDLNPNDYFYREEPIARALFRFAFTKAHDMTDTIIRINAALEAMKLDGRLLQIIHRYK